MKKLACLLIVLCLLLSAIAGCTTPGGEDKTPSDTKGETVEETEITSDVGKTTEEPSESLTEIVTEATEEPNKSTETEETTTMEKETQAPLPSIEELNNNAYGEAYYIAEGYGMNWRAGGWNVDDRFDIYNTTGFYKLTLNDHSDSEFKSFFREFDEEIKGILRLETIVVVNSTNGAAYIAFENAKGDKIVKLAEQDGYWTLTGKSESIKSDASIPSAAETRKSFVVTLEINLDKNTAFAVIDNKYVGEVSISEDASLTRVIYGLEKIGSGSIELNNADLNKNYVLSERFLALSDTAHRTPAFWDVKGGFALTRNGSGHYDDRYSMIAKISKGQTSVATRSFDPIYGKIAFETFVLLPEKVDGASVSLMSAGNEILKFETINGKFVMGDVVLHDYIANVWQNLHIDADTETGIAKIYINGKVRATVNFTAESFDSVKIEFAPDKTAEMWFDDVVLYNLYDYADYPARPQVAESTDYNVGVNVCWLWRSQNGSEGWQQSSSFSEVEPYLGYYDEGLRETADWELKYMAEHGIDFMNVCWYATTDSLTDPLKKMRNSYGALHDGYMYAKYSDLVDFCILWENTHPGATNFEQFKEIIWNYWKEYYFSDQRYLRLDNKAVLTVWSLDIMKNVFGGTEESVNAAIEWMNQELIEMGYDGLILLASVQGTQTTAAFETYAKYGLDGTYAYHYGTEGYDPKHQINANRANYKNSLGISYHVPTVSTGFNQLPRNDSRHPLITADDHLAVCEDVKALLAQYNTGTWMDNTVMISNWNEYTEGTYIFPCEQNGFTYLENIRKAFTNDTSDHSKIDVKPTEAQVQRVSHLFPDNHSAIRWYQNEASDEQKQLNDANSYTSVQELSLASWKNRDKQRGKITISGSKITGRPARPESLDIGIYTELKDPINASDATILHIRMQSTVKGKLEVFFGTGSWSEGCKVTTGITKVDTMVDYYIPMSSNSNWTGEISHLRIDPVEASDCEFTIELIELMNYCPDESNILGVNINHCDYEYTFFPVATSDGDWEVVGDTSCAKDRPGSRNNGFFALMMLYHKWDRFTGTLTIKTRDEKTIVFTVGSDKIEVDGKQQNLGYTFTLRDGLPVFRIKSLCDLLGYKYTVEANKIMIQSCTDEEYRLLGDLRGN